MVRLRRRAVLATAALSGLALAGLPATLTGVARAQTDRLEWSAETDAWTLGSPTVVDDVVYVGSRDGHLYALDAVSGDERWSFATSGAVESSATVHGESVYVGSDDGTVYAVDAPSGEEQWRYGTGDEIDATPTVALDGGGRDADLGLSWEPSADDTGEVTLAVRGDDAAASRTVTVGETGDGAAGPGFGPVAGAGGLAGYAYWRLRRHGTSPRENGDSATDERPR